MTTLSMRNAEKEAHKEACRVHFLRDLGIAEAPSIPQLDALTRSAAAEFEVPMVLITLIDSERQQIKSSFGFNKFEVPRDMAFCHHTIQRMRLLIVENTLDDPRFCNNPMVRNPPHIRFYAGAPLTIGGQFRIGGFCLLDDIPRRLGPDARRRLWRYAEEAAARIETLYMSGALPEARSHDGPR